MELLIAITIGAMVMAIIATAFHVSVANWERVRKSNDRLQVFQIADLLANQLLHLRKRPIPARGRNRTAFWVTKVTQEVWVLQVLIFRGSSGIR